MQSRLLKMYRVYVAINNVLKSCVGCYSRAVLTAIIQSSSASVGILQALCATGAGKLRNCNTDYYGTEYCMHYVILSSIGANKNAKRASGIHLYFNLIGTILFMSLFYSINFLSPLLFKRQCKSDGNCRSPYYI